MTVDFSTLPAWVNKAFYPLWFDRNRFIVCKGGAGSGKSMDAHRRVLYRMIAEPGHNYAIVRKVGRTLSISCIPLIRQCISDWNLGPLFAENKSNQTVTCTTNGNQIKFLGLDDIEKVKSITFERGPLTDVLIEEATEITEQDFNQLNLRLRGQSKVPFQITLLFNPVSDTHWMKRRFFDNPGEKRDKITLHESTYLDNRFLDPEYKEELEALKYEDRTYYEIYCLGKWGSIGNLVFRNVVYQRCPYTSNEFDQIIAGQDFGYNHRNAIELIGLKDGDKYSFRELYVRHLVNSEIIAENEARHILSKKQRCIADSAEPKSIKDWQQAGYTMIAAKKGPDSVKAQIAELNRGTWYVDPVACPGLVSEIATYKWREDRDGNPLDEPVKFRDDAIAACRYAVEELDMKKTAWVL
ncbi:PBSX family phage terminase large subunit [Spirochaetia bacterium]|nr:PBSX family phage terminase large subunit [Spirochaetia bacterium]